MAKVVGVRFRNVGKIYYFNPKNYKVKPGDHVIVETARGVEYGKVVLAPKDVVDDLSLIHIYPDLRCFGSWSLGISQHCRSIG